MKFKYSIIGLDAKSMSLLNSQLSQLDGYQEVGSVENPQELLDIILSVTPNLIFINVDNYQDQNFTDLMNIINDLYRSFIQKPLLVALASTEEQAYDCIKNNFFYYLLRPITELQVQKLNYKLRSTSIAIANLPKKICLQTYSDYRFIEIADILFLKADNNTSEFFMLDNTKIVAYKTLKHFESVLPESFSRIHQSFIINQNYISRIHLGKSECHLKPIKQRLPFSKSYRNVMAKLASNLSSNSIS
jgi:DNA-binding LytR/AlgR family response regulator